MEIHLPIVCVPIIEPDIAMRAESNDEFIHARPENRNEGTNRVSLGLGLLRCGPGCSLWGR